MGDANPAAIVLALSSVPAFLIARSLHRGASAARNAQKARLDARLARLMEAVGVIGLLAAAGLWWAGDDRGRATFVVVSMVLLVNAMVLVVLWSFFSARRKAGRRP